MSEEQPPAVVEGATAGDVEEEVQPAKSAEDRKAASALASLDARGDDASEDKVDAEAAQKAIKGLGGGATAAKKEVKNVKVDAADVTLLVSLLRVSILPLGTNSTGNSCRRAKEKTRTRRGFADGQPTLQVDELELTKPKATELLKANDGDAVKAMKAYVSP